jgi:DNA-directed RNA polymerase specialized sigma24 family protein
MSEKDIKKLYHVNSKVFRQQLEEYYESDKMTDDLAVNVMKIAEGLSYNYRFIRYSKSWKQEMVGDAVLKMYHALEKKLFRLESEFNPFSYFNRIAWNAFSQRIKKEKGQHEGLSEYKDIIYMESMTGPDSMGHIYVKPHMEGDEYDDEL